METLILQEFLSTALVGQAFLQELLDLVLKSSLILAFTVVIAALLRNRISNASSHLLWMNCLLCIALLPFAGSLLSFLSSNLLDAGPLTIITVQAAAATPIDAAGVSSNALVAALYLLITAGLLLRLLGSAIALAKLNNSAVESSDGKFVDQLTAISSRLGISRKIVLKFSVVVNSPMSFGLFRPVVILPSHAGDWNASTLEDVLVHELSHIKRLDWATMLFCHLLSRVFWINPLLWFAKARVNEAAEQACDSAVLNYGKDGVHYAEDLLRLAKMKRKDTQTPILAQLMFDESSLSLRIRNILDGSLAGKASKTFIAGLLMSAMLIVSACSGINLFGANDLDQDYLPLVALSPQYPTRAAENGISGWALVGFTVAENGRVAENSVRVVDAEPAEIFDRTSIRAAATFEFQPRVRNGRAVAVEGVQYLFRYELEDDDDSSTSGQRQPPKARNTKRYQ